MGRGAGVEVYRLLKNPIRREILSLLYTRGELSATQLKLILNVSYGTLYYHLDFLGPLITQVGRGRYKLSRKGVVVVRGILRRLGGDMNEVSSGGFSVGFLERVAASPMRYLPLGIVVAGIYLVMPLFLPIKSSMLYLRVSEPGNILSSILSLLTTVIYFIVMGMFFRRGRGWLEGLLTMVLASYIPLDLYLTILIIAEKTGIKLLSIIPILQGGFIIAHLIQLMILAAGLTYSVGLGWEKSLPATILLSYISLLITYYNIM